MKKTERHPNIDEIIKVLKHLKTIWEADSGIDYVLKSYEMVKAEQEEHNESKNRKKR
jgi:hypothetical protein